MTLIRHYYHVFAGGAWPEPVRHHIAMLGRYRLATEMTVGLVGAPPDREKAREMVLLRTRNQRLPDPVRWLEADDGYEQLTLRQIHVDAHQVPGDSAVLYMHTKGAYVNTEHNALWNWSMTRELIGEWKHCVGLLTDHDVVACHWIKAPERDHPGQPMIAAGNFWWARAAYLRQLPPPDNTTRWAAEDWVSQGDPVVYDMLPGWPEY